MLWRERDEATFTQKEGDLPYGTLGNISDRGVLQLRWSLGDKHRHLHRSLGKRFINLPAQMWVSHPDAFDPSQLSVPVLFLGGSDDLLIAPPWALLEYYFEVPGAAAMLVLNGADHLTIKNNPGGYFGYLTAWLMYQLQGDQYARGAFVGAPPEANTNTNWSWQAEKNLP